MKFDFTKTDSVIDYPVLRMSYEEKIEQDTLFEISDALTRSSLDVEYLGGGEYTKGDTFSGNADFIIGGNVGDFDLEFSKEIIESIINISFDLTIFENDPFFKEF